MHFERLPGTTNVVRFPIERRATPTLALLREIAPDVREVLAFADAFALEAPEPGLRDQVDAATAEHILNQVALHGPEREAMLYDIEAPVIVAAVKACRDANEFALAAVEARRVVAESELACGLSLEPQRRRAERLTGQAARLMVTAHARAEEAEGVSRAVAMARCGEAWAPRDVAAEMEQLLTFRHAG